LRLTDRGVKLLLAQALSTIFTVFYKDVPLLIASILTLSIILYSFYIILKAGRRLKAAECEPRNLKLRIVAGEEKTLNLIIYTPIELKLVNLPDWVKASTDTLETGIKMVDLKISPSISKIYRLDFLTSVFTDPLKIFCNDCKIPLGLEVIAYPRVLPFIIEALKMIGRTGYGGDTTGRRKGLGTEYLWSREYQMGDSLTLIDWKASARLEKLIVKEFSEEAYKAVGIVYEVKGVGPVTSDEVNALFLSSIMSVVRLGLPITLIIKNGLTIVSEYPSIDPDTALKIAISYSVKNYSTENWDVYEVLEPKTASQLLSIIREVEALGLLQTVQLKMEALNEIISKLPLQNSIIYYVGNIVVDSEFILELSSRVKMNNGELIILTSGKPWTDLDNLEQAYVMYVSHRRIVESLERAGSKIFFYKGVASKLRTPIIM